MKPGTQQMLQHCIRAERKDPSASPEEGVRYCLSFRAITTTATKKPTLQVPVQTDEMSVQRDDPVTITEPKPEPKPEPAIPDPPKRHVSLVAGDSFAARLDPVKLGKKKVKVLNVARGGSKIQDVENQLKDFFERNDDVVVDKLIISIGTNDIRYCSNGVSHLNGPLKKLCSTIENLTPNTKILFSIALTPAFKAPF